MSFTVEIQLQRLWSGSSIRFASRDEADRYAQSIADWRPDIISTRVVTSEDAANCSWDGGLRPMLPPQKSSLLNRKARWLGDILRFR